MSIDASAIVWAHSEATGSELLVLLAIADHEGDGGAWPAMETLARRGRVTRDAARKIVRRLELRGEITTDLNGGGGLRTAAHMRTNRYEVNLKCPEWCDRTARHRDLREVKADPPAAGTAPSRSAGSPPAAGTAEPSINHPNKQTPSSSEVMAQPELEIDSNQSGENYSEWSPADQLAKARRRMVEARDPKPKTSHTRPGFTVPPAPHVPRFDSRSLAPAPEHVSPEQQAANGAAAQLRCPAQGGKYRHLIPPATGTHCARCNAAAHDIINSQEAHA